MTTHELNLHQEIANLIVSNAISEAAAAYYRSTGQEYLAICNEADASVAIDAAYELHLELIMGPGWDACPEGMTYLYTNEDGQPVYGFLADFEVCTEEPDFELPF